MRSDGSGGADRIRFLTIGRIVSPFGLSGELRVEVVTDFPQRFTEGLEVRLGEELRPFRIESVRWLDDQLLIRLERCGPDCAEKLRNQLVRVPVEQAMPLPEDHYYLHQIIGLKVRTSEDRYLGTVEDVLRTGANDVYVVKGPLGEVLIPAIESVVKSIDLGRGVMTVELMEGML